VTSAKDREAVEKALAGCEHFYSPVRTLLADCGTFKSRAVKNSEQFTARRNVDS